MERLCYKVEPTNESELGRDKMKKYKLLKDDFIEWKGVTRLYRIKACKSFGDVKEGDLGGYVEHEWNLSHEGICWIYDDAKVWGNARIYNDVRVWENASIHGKACAKGRASIHGNAEIFGSALIRDCAEVGDNAKIYGSAVVGDFAEIGGNAEIFGSVQVYDFAKISGNAKIFNRARIGGETLISGDARVYGEAKIMYGSLTKDIKDDLVQYIACSLNTYPVDGKYILFKRVNRKTRGIYTSLFDSSFIYRDGEYAEIKNPDLDFLESCGGGIHVSTPFFWQDGDTLIAVEVNIEDIITCMNGKLRCKRVKVIGEVQTKM